MKPTGQHARWLALLAAASLNHSLAVDGVIPNQSYTGAEVLTAISPQLSNLHLNQPSVYNGYVVFAGNAVHQVWDIADPYSPVLRATMTSNHAAGEAESHQVTYARRPDGTAYMATISGRGVDIWNVTDTLNPALVGEIQLPGINYGDVTGGVWGVSWQGNHLYAGATTFGLYVLDVSDPTAPQHVATLPSSSMGGVAAGPLFALGSTLVVTTPKNLQGVATVDISNPTDPRLLDSVIPGGTSSYIGGFYGGNAYLITPLRVYDVTSDPTNIQLVGQSNVPPDGEYMSFANDRLFYGGLRGGTQGIYKYDIADPANPVLLGRYVGRGGGFDDQFSCPIGNLLAVADDQLVSGTYAGGLIVVSEAGPDTTPPSVIKVFPGDGSADLPTGTCVALSLSEWPELATVDATTCIVRPVGGTPVAGTWSTTTTVLCFGPDEPLLPYTDYEVVLPAGGLKDFVGNGIASTFTATFRTGAPTTGGFPGNDSISPVPPTPLGQSTSFSLAGEPDSWADYHWDFGDGSTGAGAAVMHTYTAPGRYPVRLDIAPVAAPTNGFEAEDAALGGGVVTRTNNPGFSGSGYADFPTGTGSGIAVTWTVNASADAHGLLSFRYANGDTVNRPLHLKVNGDNPEALPFPPTGAWTNYDTHSASVPHLLVEGDNTVSLVADAGSAGANIDRMDLVLYETLEAEAATLEGSVGVASSRAGFTGTGYADYTGEGPGTRICWNIVSTGSPVPLSFRYANGGTSARDLDLVVDGGPPQVLSFVPTDTWENWQVIGTTPFELAAGSHTVELVCDAGTPGPNIDSLLLPSQPPAPTSVSFTHIVHRPLTDGFPSQSRPLALSADRNTLWTVNPDNNSITRLNTADLTMLGEYPTGDHPESLALAPDGSIWVVNQGSAEITRVQADGTSLPPVPLPRASRPYGLVFSPGTAAEAFVSLEALGRVVRLDGSTGALLDSLDLPLDPDGIRPQPRGLALDASGERLLVTRFISPDAGGEVFEIDTTTFSLIRTFSISLDPGPDSSTGSRGIANYLSSVAISPDGTRAWLPSKKDNIFRGTFRDGNGLNHDQTVRSITSVLDLGSNTELPSERVDYDNRDRAHALDFSTLGDLAFVTQPGNNQVEVVDTYTGSSVTQLMVGKAPTGVLFDPVNQRVFVLNFLSRSVSGFDVSDIVNATGVSAPELAPPAPLVATEALGAQVLLGKQLFYDATSIRLNEENYMSCASCHLDGSHDGRTWDFTGFGEGLRNTIDLRGKAGTAQGRLHWSANFDEVHDFEGQIRGFGSGLGLMEDVDFNTGTRSDPLGDPKAGLSSDLDALAAYVTSLSEVPPSPWRQQDGSLTPDAMAGRDLFNRLSCFTCHGGEHFTDSPMEVLHDIWTLKPSSGQRLGGTLPGIDTPTLRGVWATAPYLHDGSAATLAAVLTTANPSDLHGETSQLSGTELWQLVAYLMQLDGSNAAALPSTGFGIPTYAKFAQQHSLTGGQTDDEDGDNLLDALEYALGATDPRDRMSAFPPVHARDDSGSGYRITFPRRAGGWWDGDVYRSGDLAYRPLSSTDLQSWGPAAPAPNPPGLAPAPSGYEWVTFILPETDPVPPRGFLKLGVEVE